MRFSKFYFLIFPVLIVVFGAIIYKVLGFDPNFYTIIINISLAFILSPRTKTLNTQQGTKEQVTWLFFKKSRIVS